MADDPITADDYARFFPGDPEPAADGAPVCQHAWDNQLRGFTRHWKCTREAGHSGDHVAHTPGGHALARDVVPRTIAEQIDLYYHRDLAEILAVLLRVPVGDRLNVLAVATRAALDSGMLEVPRG